jgi:hypothetical protein
VYTEDGVVPSKQPISSIDSALGRIKAISVAPPHTVTSIKRRICNAEAINDHTCTKLFIASSSQSPMEDEAGVSIIGNDGPGHTMEEPVALVVLGKDSGSPRKTAGWFLQRSALLGGWPSKHLSIPQIETNLPQPKYRKPFSSSLA